MPKAVMTRLAPHVTLRRNRRLDSGFGWDGAVRRQKAQRPKKCSQPKSEEQSCRQRLAVDLAHRRAKSERRV